MKRRNDILEAIRLKEKAFAKAMTENSIGEMESLFLDVTQQLRDAQGALCYIADRAVENIEKSW